MAKIDICCPNCQTNRIVKYSLTGEGKQRFRCNNASCNKRTFIVDYTHKGWLPEVKKKIVDMALNGSGVRDTCPCSGCWD